MYHVTDVDTNQLIINGLISFDDPPTHYRLKGHILLGSFLFLYVLGIVNWELPWLPSIDNHDNVSEANLMI